MVRRLVFVIHQGDGLNAQRRRGRDVRVRVMTDSKIKTTIASPLAQGTSAPDQIPCFAGNRSAAMTSNDVRRQARDHRQLNCLRKVTRSDLDLMTARDKLRNQGAKERHVRRV